MHQGAHNADRCMLQPLVSAAKLPHGQPTGRPAPLTNNPCQAAEQQQQSCIYVCIPPLQAELSYLKATSLHDKAVEAWQGLSELYHATQQWSKAVDADQQLVREGRSGAQKAAAAHHQQQQQQTPIPCLWGQQQLGHRQSTEQGRNRRCWCIRQLCCVARVHPPFCSLQYPDTLAVACIRVISLLVPVMCLLPCCAPGEPGPQGQCSTVCQAACPGAAPGRCTHCSRCVRACGAGKGGQVQYTP